MEDDDFYGYDLDHISIDDEDDSGLALTEELGADVGPF